MTQEAKMNQTDIIPQTEDVRVKPRYFTNERIGEIARGLLTMLVLGLLLWLAWSLTFLRFGWPAPDFKSILMASMLWFIAAYLVNDLERLIAVLQAGLLARHAKLGSRKRQAEADEGGIDAEELDPLLYAASSAHQAALWSAALEVADQKHVEALAQAWREYQTTVAGGEQDA